LTDGGHEAEQTGNDGQTVKALKLVARLDVLQVLLELRVLYELADSVEADAGALLNFVHALAILARVQAEAGEVDNVEHKGGAEQAAKRVLLVLPQAPRVVLQEGDKRGEREPRDKEHVLGRQIALHQAELVTRQQLIHARTVDKLTPRVQTEAGSDARQKAKVAAGARINADIAAFEYVTADHGQHTRR